MAEYYFLGTFLPELKLEIPPDINLDYLTFLLKENLTPKDLQKTEVIRRYFDLENIRLFWLGQPLGVWGNLDANALEEALVTKSGLPKYLYDYMDRYDTDADRVANFSYLLATFFQEEIAKESGFLKQLLIQERELRLVLSAIRAKKMGRDLLKEFQFEDPNDPIVAHIIAQKDAKNYEPPAEYEEIKRLYETHQDDPLELHKAMLEYRFRKMDEAKGLKVFTIDRILAYLYQLILIEKWTLMSQEKGQALLHTILQEKK